MLLDTHVLVWLTLRPTEISSTASKAMEAWLNRGKPLYFIAASFWELAIKVAKGRLDLGMPVTEFYRLCERAQGLEIVETNAVHWIDSAGLDWPHRDPIDRLLVATARQMEVELITSDQTIREFFAKCIW